MRGVLYLPSKPKICNLDGVALHVERVKDIGKENYKRKQKGGRGGIKLHSEKVQSASKVLYLGINRTFHKEGRVPQTHTHMQQERARFLLFKGLPNLFFQNFICILDHLLQGSSEFQQRCFCCRWLASPHITNILQNPCSYREKEGVYII